MVGATNSTYLARHEAKEHLAPLGLDEVQQDRERDKHSQNEADNDDLEEHHALSAGVGPEEQQDNEHINSSDEHAGPERQARKEEVQGDRRAE